MHAKHFEGRLGITSFWSGQDLSVCFDPLKNRRACLATLDDCGFLYCGRVVRNLTAQQCCATETEIYGVT